MSTPFDSLLIAGAKLTPVNRIQFLEQCKSLWHVAPAGAWDRISRRGFLTAEQLIGEAQLDEGERRTLLTAPRRHPVSLKLESGQVTLRDQGPLFKTKDLQSILGDGLSIADWIHLLNRRVYFFTDQKNMQALVDKYVKLEGAQDVLILSPMRLYDVAKNRIELAAQNTGAIARRPGVKKYRNTFMPVGQFPNQKPSEVTVLDGVDDLSVIVSAERRYADRKPEQLNR